MKKHIATISAPVAARILNLTPHAVTVLTEDGKTILNMPASGTVARLLEGASPAGVVYGTIAPLNVVNLGDVVGLPEPEQGVICVVSMPLAMGLKAAGIVRDDIVYPYGQVRDDVGRIVGCRAFARIA